MIPGENPKQQKVSDAQMKRLFDKWSSKSAFQWQLAREAGVTESQAHAYRKKYKETVLRRSVTLILTTLKSG